MKLKDILAISGKSGLYKFISQGRNGIIVESFEDHSRSLAHASAKVSALEDIAIFTATEELPLATVFKKIFEKESGKAAISHKSSPEELKKFFSEVLPDYDRDKVYVSDIKKVVNWYNLLISLNLLTFEDENNESESKETETSEEHKIEETKKTIEPKQKTSKGTSKIKAATKSKVTGVKAGKKKV
jgi:hypothetical protein